MNCAETWSDEIGHDFTTNDHFCARAFGTHSRHICTCGAEMWEEVKQ